MNFSRIPDPANLPANLKNAVIAIGNFDGVHRGHQSVLKTALAQARKLNVPAIVLTFEPHPKTFFRPNQPVFRLTDAYTKARLLAEIGFDAVIEHTFDAAFANTTAGKFVEEVWLESLVLATSLPVMIFISARDVKEARSFCLMQVKGLDLVLQSSMHSRTKVGKSYHPAGFVKASLQVTLLLPMACWVMFSGRVAKLSGASNWVESSDTQPPT